MYKPRRVVHGTTLFYETNMFYFLQHFFLFNFIAKIFFIKFWWCFIKNVLEQNMVFELLFFILHFYFVFFKRPIDTRL